LRVPRGSTLEIAILEEDLRAEENSRVVCTGEGKSLKVQGDIRCEGSVEFVGNVTCRDFRGDYGKVKSGSLFCQSLSIRDGSMEVIGDLTTGSVDVDKRLSVSGRTEAEYIEVGGVLNLGSVKARSIEVGGTFRSTSDVEVEEIDVGGTVVIEGKTKAKSVDVGGKVSLNGGEITGQIEVGGIFESSEPLNFGDIDVGGVVTLSGPSRGGDVEVGGKLRAKGDLEFRNLEIGGVADVEGKAIGERIELGGRLRIASLLKLTDSLEVGGSAEIGGDAEARSVEVSGSLRSRSLRVEEGELRGHVATEQGIFAKGPIVVERKSHVEGWIRSLDSVLVESKGEVESVAAPKITMGDRSRAINLYAELLEIEENVEIRGEALFTSEVRVSGSIIGGPNSQPRKVDKIPPEKDWNVELSSPSKS
jgi:cytoskeletal protein CcmA (bactofilin family)